MAIWSFTKSEALGGRFQLVINKLKPGGRAVDVTEVRGAATQFNSFSNSDPFGDSVAVFGFPSITPFDDLDASDLGQWLGYYSNVDLYWVPAMTLADAGSDYPDEPLVINSLTNQPDVICPAYIRPSNADRRIKIWEGFLTAMDFTVSGGSASLEVQCQGALFQLDRYLQKPFYPARPWPLEMLIRDAVDPDSKPHLRTKKLITQFPAGWKNVVPAYNGSPNTYTPMAKPGTPWTGYTSRATGAWDHTLTGFIQDQLQVMLTDEDSGVVTGNQWTLQHVRQSAGYPQGRQPVLLVRDRFRTPDFEVWVGTPGMDLQISGDSTQSENVIYGDGTGVDGTGWRNAVISDDGSRTDYLPLAASPEIYPYKQVTGSFTPQGTALRNPTSHAFASEAYTKYGPGFDQTKAISVAKQSLARDQEPGWSGSLSLRTDPSTTLSRWLVRAGMTVLIKGVMGTGDRGIPFHISSVQASPMDGSVQLTIDTRYRDLLTVEEALARTRDPLTPVKMLQVNRTSVLIEDIQAPWDYSAGSGYIPKKSKAFHDQRPANQGFPYVAWAKAHPPLHYGGYYVKVNANYRVRAHRWAGPIPILTSEKGTINRTEFFAVDVLGNPVPVPFHVSIYYVNVTVSAMPRDKNGPSPYIDGAFESVNPSTGQPWPAGNFLAPDQSFIVGWGNRSQGVYNRAGFWPGRETDGARPTGLMVDESTWTFDNTNNPNYDKLLKPGQREPTSSITLYAMFYCEYKEPVYFMGRLFRQNPGAT